ncbi:MAG: hypothetical protein EXQ94_07815 [Alphaproteobacteria bacterium]|nr:hypothetical protein [Alphaproteobacteria bacterium]
MISRIDHSRILAPAIGALTLMAIAGWSAPASATLVLRAGFQDAALSIDACGAVGNVCSVQTDVPAGATVLQAFLYGANIFGGGLADLTLAGNSLPVAAGEVLLPNTNPANHIVHDVTSIVKPLIEGGPGGVQSFTVTEAFGMDGEILVVAYRHATTVGSTAIILDGELALAGDTTKR